MTCLLLRMSMEQNSALLMGFKSSSVQVLEESRHDLIGEVVVVSQFALDPSESSKTEGWRVKHVIKVLRNDTTYLN